MIRTAPRWLWFLVFMSLVSLFFFPATSYAATSWLKYFRKDTLLNTYMRSYAVSGDRLWVGTYGDGVVVYDGNTTRNFNTKNTRSRPEANDGLVSDLVTCMAVDDRGGRVWIGTNEGLSACSLDATEWKRYTARDGLPNEVIRDVAVDEKGNVWVGTPSGLAMFNGDAWKVFTSSNGLYEDSVQAITVEGGAVWVATVGGSVNRFNGDSWKVLIHR